MEPINEITAVNALAALAQGTRLKLYRLLVQVGPEGRVVSQIADMLPIPAATLSFHLRTLAQAGLIHAQTEGRFIRYRADFMVMHGLLDYLSENCCGSDRTACEPLSTPVFKDCR